MLYLLSSYTYLEITYIELIAHLFLKYVQLVNQKKEMIGIIFKWIKHLDNTGNSVLSKY